MKNQNCDINRDRRILQNLRWLVEELQNEKETPPQDGDKPEKREGTAARPAKKGVTGRKIQCPETEK